MGRDVGAFGITLVAAGAALALSALAAVRFGLIFHFHPAVVAAGAPWLYRMLLGHAPSNTALAAMVAGAAALVIAYQRALEPLGFADGPALTAALTVLGLVVGIRMTQRPATGPRVETSR